MSEKTDKGKPRISATLIAYVHDTSDNAVRTAKSRWTPKTDEYIKTEEQIAKAVERLRVSKNK